MKGSKLFISLFLVILFILCSKQDTKLIWNLKKMAYRIKSSSCWWNGFLQ